MINFREAVAAREKAETAEEIQHLLAKFTERGEVLKSQLSALKSAGNYGFGECFSFRRGV